MIRITNQLESGSCTSKHPYNLDQLGDHGCGRKRNIMQRNQLNGDETEIPGDFFGFC